MAAQSGTIVTRVTNDALCVTNDTLCVTNDTLVLQMMRVGLMAVFFDCSCNNFAFLFVFTACQCTGHAKGG